MDFVKKEQGRVGVSARQAVPILREKLRRLISHMRAKRLQGNFRQLKNRRNIALYCLVFAVAKRIDDATNVVAKNVLEIPNGGGLLFNFTWGKTLRSGKNHMFGVECSCDTCEVLCAVCRIGEYVQMAKKCGWDFDVGYLFSRMSLKKENDELSNSLARTYGGNANELGFRTEEQQMQREQNAVGASQSLKEASGMDT